jgi:tartrate-resistant acid phosphatase type 5
VNIKRHIITSLFVLSLPFTFYGQRFAIVSDIHGETANTLAVSNLVKSWNPDFIVTSGDNFYPFQDSIDNQVGQYYHDFIFPYVGHFGSGDTVNRFFPALGNHDYDNNGLSQYLSYFNLPGNERYYDFVKGNVHFYIINSFASEPDGTSDTSLQSHWLKSNLSHSTSLYNLVYFHYPPYSSGMHGSSVQMQWPFRQWGATAVISGHDHDYERLLVNGFPYIVNGLGGGAIYTYFLAIPGSHKHYAYKHGAILAIANTDSISFDFINNDDSLVDHYAIMNLVSGISQEQPSRGFELFENSPNPVSAVAIIKFSLPAQGKVSVALYNVMGEKVSCLPDEMFGSGMHEETLDCENLSMGLYFCKVSYRNFVKTAKLNVYHE